MRRGAPEAEEVGEGAPRVCSDCEFEGFGEAGGKGQGRGADDT